MNTIDVENKKISSKLLCLDDRFNLLTNLLEKKNLPRALMISGIKGSGKFTLIAHFLCYVFDKNNYDVSNKLINTESNFFSHFINNTFPNIVYIPGSNFKSVKIDDIRELKSLILKSSMFNKERFIIFDDVELLNQNSLNALLKIIEEPSSNNHFIIINNQTKPIIETLHSRCIEIKLSLKESQKIEIINYLIKKNQLEKYLDYNIQGLTPGNFLEFNNICDENKIDVNNNLLENITSLLNLFKKTKNKNLINFIFFLIEYHFYSRVNDKKNNTEKLFEQRDFIIKNMKNFINYNINQASLLNAISNKLYNE